MVREQINPLYSGLENTYNPTDFTTAVTNLARPADAEINRFGADGYIPNPKDYQLAEFIKGGGNLVAADANFQVTDFSNSNFDGEILRQIKRLNMNADPMKYRTQSLRHLLGIRQYFNDKYYKNRKRYMQENHLSTQAGSQMALQSIQGEMATELQNWRMKWGITGNSNDDLILKAVQMNEQNATL